MKSKPVFLNVYIGSGSEAQKIKDAVKSKAHLSGKSLADFILTSCFHTCAPVLARAYAPQKVSPVLTPKPGKDVREIDYSNSDDPPMPQLDLSQMPSGRPQPPELR